VYSSENSCFSRANKCRFICSLFIGVELLDDELNDLFEVESEDESDDALDDDFDDAFDEVVDDEPDGKFTKEPPGFSFARPNVPDATMLLTNSAQESNFKRQFFITPLRI
jgi:hypothetical protein